ncbi:hypothetical protein KKA13_00440 [Patescibacteria group bacterium]|nr:hypothetical protein [Patescibacteria group bacterium]MBU1613215.1 hypothetical protein [Patescibacteria group bacterium]
MFGVLLMSLGTFFQEAADSLGKWTVQMKEQSVFSMGFLSLVFQTLFFALIILVNGNFVFSPASLPTFLVRSVLEILQAHFTIVAICRAERSAFAFIRTLTMPLLLATDMILGYSLNNFQIGGILLIMVSLFVLTLNNGFKKEGLLITLFVAVNAVITTSLYKYDITRFNSVEAEQIIICAILLIYFFIGSVLKTGKNPIRLLAQRKFFAQSMSYGAAGLLESFAYSFAPASIILSVKRSSAVIWSVLFGRIVFREDRLRQKTIGMCMLVAGVVLLVL